MRCATFASLLLVTWAELAAQARADSTQVVLRVVVNMMDMGDRFVSRLGPDDFALTRAELRRIGLQLPQATASDSSLVSLRTLAPGVRFMVDESSASLLLTVAPELLPVREIAVGGRRGRTATPLDAACGFLNYGVIHTMHERGPAGAWSVPIEAGVRARGWLALSTFSGIGSTGTRDMVRLSSSLTRDDPRHVRRIVLGDVAAGSGSLGRSVLLVGVRISSEFALARDLEITPRHEVEGVLETPSDVELRVNGALVRRDHLAPGTFRYSDLRLGTGAGEVTLTVRDAFGDVRTIASPHYHSRSLLEPGLADYSWSLGFERRSFGRESFAYGRPVLVGRHRVAWSRTTTVGIGVEGGAERGMLAPAISRTVGALGEIQAILAASRDRRGTGTAWSVRGLSSAGRLGVDFSAEGTSAGFTNLGAGSRVAPLRLGAALGVSWSSCPLGGIGLRVSRSDVRGRSVEERASASWSRRLARKVSMTTRVVRIRGARADIEASTIVSLGLGPSRSAGLSARQASAGHGIGLHLQQSAPPGPGFEHRLQVEGMEASGGQTRGSTVLASRYQGSHGQWGITRRQRADAGSWEVSAGGSVAWVGGSLFLGRPIRDGFAVVRVRDMRGVPVLVHRQPRGVTDRRGVLLVPGLTPHDANTITLDDRSLPTDWSLVQREQVVSPPFRGGGVVEFVARRFQSVEGRVLVVRHGIATPAEYAGFEVEDGAATLRSIIGKKGLFYFENLPAGEHRARVFLDGRECRFVLRVPQSEATTVDLGEIRCEASEGQAAE